MAQHHEADLIDDKTVKRIVSTIRRYRKFDISFRYYRMSDGLKNSLTDRVYGCTRKVPKEFGGRALFEIHTEPTDGGRIATKIYMVI